MGELIATAIFSMIIAAIFIGIGVKWCKSEQPIVMNTGEKRIATNELTDVKAWNVKHGKMLIMYGIGAGITLFGTVWMLMVTAIDASVLAIVCILLNVIYIMAILGYHSKLERMYRVK